MALLRKTAVGLDISDDSIEVVEIQKSGSTVKVLNKNRVTIPEEFIVDGKIQDMKGVGMLLREAFDKAQPQAITSKNVYTFFPEQLSYTAVLRLDMGKGMTPSKLTEYFQAHVSVPLAETVYTHLVRSQERGVASVLFYAVPRSIFNEWNQLFSAHDITVAGYEPEMFAVVRALKTTPFTQKKKDTEAVAGRGARAVIDLGAETTTLALYDKQGLVGTYASSVGGDWITRGIAKALKIDIDKAEAKKKTLALSGSGKGVSVVKEAFGEIGAIFHDLVDYYGGDEGLRITEVFLIGGGADFKGVEKYCSDAWNVPVTKGVYNTERVIPAEGSKLSHLYMGAVGAALRGVDKSWSDSILLEPREVKAPARVQRSFQDTRQKSTHKERLSQETLAQSTPSFVGAHAKELALIVILLLGAFALVVGYWYRAATTVDNRSPEITPGFSIERTTLVDVPVIVAPSQYAADAVRGRLSIKSVLDAAIAGDELLAMQREQLQLELNEGEALWETPLRSIDAQGSEVDLGVLHEDMRYPILATWLIFSEQEVTSTALRVLSMALGEQQFIFDSLSVINARIVDDSMVALSVELTYLLDMQAAISDQISHERLEPESFEQEVSQSEVTDLTTEESVQDPVVGVPTVVITQTGVGFLNVRSGPGTSFPTVTQVTPGDIYPFDEIQNGWYHILIDSDLAGWVVGTFVIEQ